MYCCEARKKIWYLSPLRIDIQGVVVSSFEQWVMELMTRYKDKEWWSLFWALCCWLERNAWQFNGKTRGSMEAIQKAVSLVGEYEKAKVIRDRRPVLQSLARWSPPSSGCFK